jgi:hypothetical protein
MASEQYRNFFVAIVPELKSILIKTVVVPNLDTQNSESSTNWSMSSSSLNITDPKVLINLNKLICYLFTAVPLEQLIRIELVPKIFDYLFDQLVSPFILSQVNKRNLNIYSCLFYLEFFLADAFDITKFMRTKFNKK